MMFQFIIATVMLVASVVARRYLYSIIFAFMSMAAFFAVAFEFANDGLPAFAAIFAFLGITAAFYGIYNVAEVIR